MGSCHWNFVLGRKSIGVNAAERTVSLTAAGRASEVVRLVTGSKEHEDIILSAVLTVTNHPVLVRRA